ncbi:glycosyltransferase [Paenibacillus sp. IB182496]|uniref:Glycosyltransferase n=1 Tax=Paenibacillus sabuli TaxID=2772509 RepID=A0A927BVF1_9BACL|nr:glycosyltransferase [Paenibacillus sabuli]MBD2847558.1 glycosyltransferase [Paenibacillus sabuli]
MRAFIIDNLVFGGAERQATYLINNQDIFDEIFLLEGVKKYKLTTSKPINEFSENMLKIYKRPYGDIQFAKKLESKFNSQDLVVSFLERSNIINIRSSFKTGHRAIISIRNFMSERYRHPKYTFRKILIKKYYPKADLIITNSHQSKLDLIQNFSIPEHKIKVIYNIIDLEKINFLKNEKLPLEHQELFQSPIILNIGSLTTQKAQLQLIEAYSKFKERNSEYKLVIIGEGPQRERLSNYISKLRLEKNVILIGNVDNPFKYLKFSRIFVLNSNYEGFPNVLLESLAVGIPIISKNCKSGPKELLEVCDYDNSDILLTKYGYLFPRLSDSKGDYNKEVNFLNTCLNNMVKLIDSERKNSDFKGNCLKRGSEFSKDIIIPEWENMIKIQESQKGIF